MQAYAEPIEPKRLTMYARRADRLAHASAPPERLFDLTAGGNDMQDDALYHDGMRRQQDARSPGDHRNRLAADLHRGVRS